MSDPESPPATKSRSGPIIIGIICVAVLFGAYYWGAKSSKTNVDAHSIASGPTRPAWASEMGTDQYGTWADLQVAGMVQRFRWIQPGTFTMGSSQAEKDAALASMPNSKPAWFSSEVQHQVTLTQGFWLADSACTQALWQAITGSNPAKFSDSPQNPVEQVSWDDCQQFLSKLNAQVASGGFCLPSEAQWEYACRAGTTTAFSFGSKITPEQVNYNGNSLFGGAAQGLNREKTVPVKSLSPNAWGLYEMHGNVWQWCNDWYGDFSGSAERDPTGPSSGAGCVLRGGGWSFNDVTCRSASRFGITPGSRDSVIGVRIAAQSTEQNAKSKELIAAVKEAQKTFGDAYRADGAAARRLASSKTIAGEVQQNIDPAFSGSWNAVLSSKDSGKTNEYMDGSVIARVDERKVTLNDKSELHVQNITRIVDGEYPGFVIRFINSGNLWVVTDTDVQGMRLVRILGPPQLNETRPEIIRYVFNVR